MRGLIVDLLSLLVAIAAPIVLFGWPVLVQHLTFSPTSFEGVEESKEGTKQFRTEVFEGAIKGNIRENYNWIRILMPWLLITYTLGASVLIWVLFPTFYPGPENGGWSWVVRAGGSLSLVLLCVYQGWKGQAALFRSWRTLRGGAAEVEVKPDGFHIRRPRGSREFYSWEEVNEIVAIRSNCEGWSYNHIDINLENGYTIHISGGEDWGNIEKLLSASDGRVRDKSFHYFGSDEEAKIDDLV